MELIDRQAIRQSVQEKLIKACGRLYESERAACESDMPLPWDDEPWEEFVWRYQDYELVFKYDMDITKEDLNYDDYETDRQRESSSGDREKNTRTTSHQHP